MLLNFFKLFEAFLHVFGELLLDLAADLHQLLVYLAADRFQFLLRALVQAIELGFQKLGAYSQRVSGHLYDDLLGQDFGAEQVRKTRYTLPSDHSHLDCIAIRQGCQDGSQTLLHKIELPDRRAGLVEDLSLRQGNRIQVQKEIVESCSGQCAQDPVSDCANA